MHNSQFLCFLNGGDALSGLGDAEGEHGEVVAELVGVGLEGLDDVARALRSVRGHQLDDTVFAKYLWIQLASAMTMVEIGKNYWEDYIYKHKGLQYIEKGFDMVFPPEE